MMTAWLLLAPLALVAQSASLKGRVLTDSTERPIAGVTVSIESLKLQATTDSLGNFSLIGIRPGIHIVSARKIGFGPLTSRLDFAGGTALEADLLLTPNVQALPDVMVETKAPLPVSGKLVEFEQRRAEGHGRFMTAADIEKHALSKTVNVLRTSMPGLVFQKDEPYPIAGRMSLPACAMCGGAKSNGAMVPCYAAVVVDGAMVYGAGDSNEPKFDVNSIDPGHIAGVEFYVGAATMPVKYNATRHTCGLLVIWTK